MFDIGGIELLVVAVVAILVVGPKDLPKMLRTFGRYVGQIKRMATDFQGQMDSALREAELDEVKATFDKASKLNPKNALKDGVNSLMDSDDAFDDLDLSKDISGALDDPAPAKAEADATAASAEKTSAAPAKKAAPKRATKPKASTAKTATTKKSAPRKTAAKKPAAKSTASKTASKSASTTSA